jgi:hypothetical protein
MDQEGRSHHLPFGVGQDGEATASSEITSSPAHCLFSSQTHDLFSLSSFQALSPFGTHITSTVAYKLSSTLAR